MIIYDLICDGGHEFEGWFKGADDLDDQKARGLLSCPICETYQVHKKLTAARVTKKSNAISVRRHDVAIASNQSSEQFAHVQEMVRRLHDYVDTNFEDVGNKFADQAISMHKGERDTANIRGTASQDQIQELALEGISAVALPPKPIDKNKLN